MRPAIWMEVMTLVVAFGAPTSAQPAVDSVLGALASDRAEFTPTMALTRTEHGDATISLGELTTEERIPKQARKLYQAALEAERKGNHELAEERMRMATEIAPDFFQAHAALAVAYLNTGRVQEAEEQLEISLDLEPNYLPAREIKGLVLFFRGRLQEATDLLSSLVKRAPCRKTLRYFLGRALLRLGESERAEYHIGRAKELARRPRPWVSNPWVDSSFRPRFRSP